MVVAVVFIVRVETVILITVYFPDMGFLVHRVQEGRFVALEILLVGLVAEVDLVGDGGS